jgi:muconolactone delta-isomerase
MPDDWQSLAREQFARWGIPDDAATAAGMFAVPDAHAVHDSYASVPAIVLPYFALDGTPMLTPSGAPFGRVRYLAAPPVKAGFAKPDKPQRYAQPPESGTHAYFPPGLDLRGGAVLTEGEAKALAATLAGIPTIALGGVYNFIDKAKGALLPELEAIGWSGKSLTICFDSDAATNPQIQAAEARLAEEFMRRGATVKLARLPGRSDGGKVGMDDYLLSDGVVALRTRLAEAMPLGRLDAAVLDLNRWCAWVEAEGMVYDLKNAKWMPKQHFVNGAWPSAIKIPASAPARVVGRKRKDILGEKQEVQVAPAWLKSSLARRYNEALFRPGAEREIEDDSGAPALNLWTGWREAPGDVAPWLKLTDYLFSMLPEEHRALPLNWLAYKAQNPALKIPLALVIVGEEGTGKSFWCKIVRDAFAPYGTELSSDQLTSPYQGWLERSLMCCINEAKGDDVTFGSDNLKTLISDETRPMNEKYRPVRQVRSYASYILTSNRREVGSYNTDNRRMFVVSTPEKPLPPEFYASLEAWNNADGPKHVMYYLRHLDLKGWKPPPRAPLTQEKAQAATEALTPVQELAYDCKQLGGLEVITSWLDRNRQWSESMADMRGRYTDMANELLRVWDTLQLRPWYTAKEIAQMFPCIAAALYGNRRLEHTPAGVISRELRNAGIPYLLCADDPRGFLLHKRREQYLVLAEIDSWRQPISQVEFERLIRSYPRYSDTISSGKKPVSATIAKGGEYGDSNRGSGGAA